MIARFKPDEDNEQIKITISIPKSFDDELESYMEFAGFAKKEKGVLIHKLSSYAMGKDKAYKSHKDAGQ